jgi:hypothetical protein
MLLLYWQLLCSIRFIIEPKIGSLSFVFSTEENSRIGKTFGVDAEFLWYINDDDDDNDNDDNIQRQVQQ